MATPKKSAGRTRQSKTSAASTPVVSGKPVAAKTRGRSTKRSGKSR